MKAYVVSREDRISIVAPYVQAFVADLKETVPYTAREWEPDSKSWVIFEPYTEGALEVVARHYDTLETVFPRPPKAYEPPAAPARDHDVAECLRRVRGLYDHHATLHVLPDAPVSVIRGAYRALAGEHHPDRPGGSREVMTRLNLAYERLAGR